MRKVLIDEGENPGALQYGVPPYPRALSLELELVLRPPALPELDVIWAALPHDPLVKCGVRDGVVATIFPRPGRRLVPPNGDVVSEHGESTHRRSLHGRARVIEKMS